MTNADWIRSMSNEELCWFLMNDSAFPCDVRIGKPPFCDLGKSECEECIRDWLKKEAQK